MTDQIETTEEEREGVEAIQYLLKMGGGSEPEAVSLANWRGFSQREKDSTMRYYEMFNKGPNHG